MLYYSQSDGKQRRMAWARYVGCTKKMIHPSKQGKQATRDA